MQRECYEQVALSTSSPQKSVLLLIEGLIRFALQGKKAIENRNPELANQRLQQAQEVAAYLEALVNPEAGELAQMVKQLYAFVRRQLIEANMRKDQNLIDDAVEIVGHLRDGWEKYCQANPLPQGTLTEKNTMSITAG